MKNAKKLAGAAVLAAAIMLPQSRGAELDFRTDINPALLYFQAYQNFPELSPADQKHLTEWSGDAPLDPGTAAILKQFDNSFKLVRRARFAHPACDWGYDLSDGPEALLPGLAPAKRISQILRMRGMAALDANQFEAFSEDFAGTASLARNLSRDRVLISTLVQFAMENILQTFVMENFYRLSADQLDQLVAAFDSAPPRGSVAATIPTEHDGFYGYTLRKVQGMAAASQNNSQEFWTAFSTFWNRIASEPDSKSGPDPAVEQIKQASGGTPQGLIDLLNELPPLYAEVEALLSLPYLGYEQQAPAFWKKIANSPNPLVKTYISPLEKIRGKEFAAIVRQEMLRAASAYKRGGVASLSAVNDPLIGGPFEFSRVQFEGVDRGFELRSNAHFRDFDEAQIFIETPGKHFHLDGRNVGAGF
jgi:hypothetical protein